MAVGLDITERKIRMLSYHKGYREKVILENIEIRPANETLKSLVEAGQLEKRQAVMVVRNDGCERIKILLPPMPEADIRNAVEWELRSNYHYQPDLVAFDYTSYPYHEQVLVYAFVMDKKLMHDKLTELRQSGLRIASFEPLEVALIMSLKANQKLKAGKQTAILEISDDTMCLVVADGEELEFVRYFPASADQLLRSLDFFYAESRSERFETVYLCGEVDNIDLPIPYSEYEAIELGDGDDKRVACEVGGVHGAALW